MQRNGGLGPGLNSRTVWSKKPALGDLHQRKVFATVTTSFYFLDFPEDWQRSDMWKRFIHYGHVADVFVSSKREKNGNRFGFLRFLRVQDVEELSNRLQDMKVGGYHLFIKPALFHRSNGHDQKTNLGKAKLKGNPKTQAGSRAAPSLRQEGTTYMGPLKIGTR